MQSIYYLPLSVSLAMQVQLQGSHDDELKLGEFTLGTISTSVHMLSDNSMKAAVRLANCLLDDKRPSIKMVTPR